MGRVAPLWGCRVLVVEDEATIAIDLARTLEEQGATIIGPVSAVEEALRCIEETHVDCALLDIRLGDETIWPVADALERELVPFVFVTGYSSRLPADRYKQPTIEKPYNSADVIRTVAGVLSKPTGA
jgi:CheY-like chemotaxis protein